MHELRAATDRVSGVITVADDLSRLLGLTVEIDLRAFDAGDLLRNHELHRLLDTARHPTARLELDAPASITDGVVAFSGTIHYRGHAVRYALRASRGPAPDGQLRAPVPSSRGSPSTASSRRDCSSSRSTIPSRSR
jgi:polyisoprenoid-binding protein YceI